MNNTYLWTAIVTPLNSDMTVDFESFENILKEQEAASNGVLILGSTGEALNLSLKVKEEIIEFAIKLDLKIPLMAGVSGHDMEATISWIKYLNQFPISCYLCVTPLYAKPGVIGQTLWFKNCLDSSTKPVVLYNVPGRTGVKLHPDVISNLFEHKNLWALKEASGSVEDFITYKIKMKDKPVFCGDDGLMLEFAKHGSCGLISVGSNVWPKETNLYVKKCLSQEIEKIDVWTNAVDALFEVSNPIPTKVILFEQKRIKSPTLMLPLTNKELESTHLQISADKNIQNWFKEFGE